MLVLIHYSKNNNVAKATISVETSELERAYMRTYGEPKVFVGGELAMDDPSRSAQHSEKNQAFSGVVRDSATGKAVLLVSPISGLDLAQIRIGDVLHVSSLDVGFDFTGVEVLGVDSINRRILVSRDLPNNFINVDPFTVPVSHGVIQYKSALYRDAVARFVSDSMNSYTDLFLRPTLSGVFPFDQVVQGDVLRIYDVPEPYEALNSGNSEWIVVEAAEDPPRIRIQSSAGTSPISGDVIFTIPKPRGNVVHEMAKFRFETSKQLAYIVSNAPFELSLSQTTDPFAEHKVRAWAEETRRRLFSAMDELKRRPDPTKLYPRVEAEEQV